MDRNNDGMDKMKYYVTADVHGYFTALKTALADRGFFEDTEPHKLIICGDLFDRGGEALQLQEFLLDLMAKDQLILIRGNHEDLAVNLLNNWDDGSYLRRYHFTNGTMDTVCQLTKMELGHILLCPEDAKNAFSQTPYIRTLIPAMVDYFETESYVFTHGWIPCESTKEDYRTTYTPIVEWRTAPQSMWSAARWLNGMEAAHNGIIEPGKTIVCGHWNTSFGHCHYEHNGGEFNNNPNFSPYYEEGIIALDACTPLSGKVNCIVVED